jgi:phage terminase large subunit-like protein
LLLGPPALREEWGTGAIPGTKIRAVSRMPQPTNAVDLVSVEHVSGGTSVLQFKSYSQGREKWQGPSIDLIWLDEEPPMEIYMEALTRTNATKGGTMITFTPLLGMSQVVRLFIATEDDLKKHEE